MMKKDLETAAEKKEHYEIITYDLKKTHPLPETPTGIAYYKQQLNLFNLGLHIGFTTKGIFNVWHVEQCRTMWSMKQVVALKRLHRY